MPKHVTKALMVFTIFCLLSGCGGGGDNKDQTANTQQLTDSNTGPSTNISSDQPPQPTANQSDENGSSVVISTVSVSNSSCGDQNITSGQYDEMKMSLTNNPDFDCTGGWYEIYSPENCTMMNKIPGTNNCYHAGVDISKADAYGRSAFAGVYGRVVYADTEIPPNNSLGRVTMKISDNSYCTSLHLSRVFVANGTFVCPTTEIGHIGNTGATGAHLHYECSPYNSAVNDAANSVNPYEAMKNGQRVVFDYDYSFVSESDFPSVKKGDVTTVEINLRNDSTQTLYKNGQNPFRLGTDCYTGYCDDKNYRDRPSEFSDSTWKSNNRVEMVQDTVPPCGIATFRFHLNTTGSDVQIGKQRIHFTPVLEHLMWLKNIGIYLEIEVLSN